MNVVIFTDERGNQIAEKLLPLSRDDALSAYDRFCQPGIAPAGSVVACYYEGGQLRRQTPVIAAEPTPEPVVEDVVIETAPAKPKKVR